MIIGLYISSSYREKEQKQNRFEEVAFSDFIDNAKKEASKIKLGKEEDLEIFDRYFICCQTGSCGDPKWAYQRAIEMLRYRKLFKKKYVKQNER